MSETDENLELTLDLGGKEREFRITPQKQAFAYHLARTGRVGESAKLAGYSHENTGSRLLAQDVVQELVAQELRKVISSEGESEESVIARAANWANGDIGDYFEPNTGWTQIKDLTDLSAEQRRRIKKVKITPGEFGNTIDLELHDPMKANAELAKYLGMLDKQSDDDLPTLEKMADDLRATLNEMDEVEGATQNYKSTGGNAAQEKPTTH